MHRFRQTPSFGRDTIRRFSSNTSELKKLGARDFEDILQVGHGNSQLKPSTHNHDSIQCAIPVLEDLLPEPHNTMVVQLVFISAHWHGLAKLRLHTDLTLGIMDRLTTELGTALRNFEEHICAAYVTRELPCEMAARQRRQKAKKDILGGGAALPDGVSEPEKEEPKRLKKALNLQTYKHHSLGDYVNTIRRYGTTDSYSSQTACLINFLPCIILNYH
jgi:hypothetical protein